MTIEHENELLKKLSFEDPLPEEWYERRRKRLAELRSQLQGKADSFEKAGDVNEWKRAMRKLVIYFPETKLVQVSASFHGALMRDALERDDVLGNELANEAGRLTFRRVQVEARAS